MLIWPYKSGQDHRLAASGLRKERGGDAGVDIQIDSRLTLRL